MFRVRWKRSARDELANLWVQGDSLLRAAITTSANAIDVELAENPTSKGESRGTDDRVFFIFPLGVRFEVDETKNAVRVLQVWSYRKRD